MSNGTTISEARAVLGESTRPTANWPPPCTAPRPGMLRRSGRRRSVASTRATPESATDARLGRRFRALWAAAVTSGLGDGLVLVAFPLLAARLTDDARLVSGISAAAALPWLLAGLPAGVLADRLDRRRLMVTIEMLRAATVGALAVSVALGWSSLAVLYVAVFGLGLGQTVFSAASSAELPRLVSDRELGRANGYLLAAEMASEQTIGPAIGGVLFGLAAAAPFVVDGVSFALAAVLVAIAIPHRPVPGRLSPGGSVPGRPVQAAATTKVRWSIRADLRAGWRHFLADDLLVLLAGFIAVLAFCQAMVLSTLVLSALDRFGLTSGGYGLLLGSASLGSVAGGVAGGRIDRRLGPALTISGAALIAGLGYAVVGFTVDPLVAGFGLALEATAITVGNVSSITLRQRRVPGHLLGRVGNIIRWCIFGVVPLGALTGGVLAERVSLRTPFLLAAVIQLIAVSMFTPDLARLCRRWRLQR